MHIGGLPICGTVFIAERGREASIKKEEMDAERDGNMEIKMSGKKTKGDI